MMVRSSRLERRRGAVLALFALVLVALCAYLALAIDIGVMAVARGQSQNAADAAAMNAVRQLNGSTGGNAIACQPAAQLAVNSNSFLGNTFASVAGVQVGGSPNSPGAVLSGYYYYSQTASSFLLSFPNDMTQSSTGASASPGGNLTAVQAMVTINGSSTYFGKVLGIASFNTQTTATAIDRPRDIGLCVDFSGSMRFSSMVGVDYSGGRYCTNNPGANQPAFGHYNSTDGAQSVTNSLNTGNLMQMTAPVTISPIAQMPMQACNLTESNGLNLNRPLLVNDFFSNAQGASATVAFSGQPNTYATTPGGDSPLQVSSTWQKTASGFLQNSGVSSANSQLYNQKFETGSGTGVQGYNPNSVTGYTVGPNYWGIRFMIWPPIPPKLGGNSGSPVGNIATNTNLGTPNTFTTTGLALDWRQAFFINNAGGPVTNNTLFSRGANGQPANGAWLTPSLGNYKINYAAILKWIWLNPNNPFPSQMRAGNIRYYSAYPNYSDANLNSRFWAYSGSNLANLDEQFWKDYIDWCLGFYQWGGTTWTYLRDPSQNTSYAGYGGDVQWKDSNNPTQVYTNPTGTSGNANTTTTNWYRYGVNNQDTMDYRDNPYRELTFGWFGPMSLVDFLGSYNVWWQVNFQRSFAWPGTAHEAVTYVCKLGLQAALQDSQNNHPNDNFTMAYYSVPMDGNPPSDPSYRFNRPIIPLGQNYQSAINHLWYPPSTLDNPGTEITPYDYANNLQSPRAGGGTCYSMGLMLLYNQFSADAGIQGFNPSPAPNGDAGGLGRIGAQKLVIMETDGYPNTTATASWSSGAGTYKGYYQILYNSSAPGSSQFPSVGNGDNSSTITQKIVTDFAYPNGSPTPRKPVKVYCIAFGPMFDPTNTSCSGFASTAIGVLNNLQTIGGNGGVTVPKIYGDDTAMSNGLQTAITNIFQSEIPVSLIKGANQNQ